jgi:glycosyltransferase involved in cell wall biosynthesis
MLANDGDWQAIDLYLQYSKTYRAMLWSPRDVNQTLKMQYPIQEIKAYSGQSPSTGTLIICGAHTEIGHWYENTHFDKVILIHNLVSPTVLYKALNRLTLYGRKVEIIYVSEMVKQIAGLIGEVVHHIPHAERFKPIVKNTYQESKSFTVGRISTDVLSKHHHGDPKVYRALADLDMQVRVIGGTCLAPWVNQTQYQYGNIHLLPAIPQTDVAQTYNGFDCFYYRTPSTVREAYGLGVIEAILSGLPVVCHRSGGYAEVIQHGINGFLFDTENEAIELISLLKNNANLCQEIGNQAKNLTVESINYNLDQPPPQQFQ